MRRFLTPQEIIYHVANTKGHPLRVEVSTLIGLYNKSANEDYLKDAFTTIIERNPPIAQLCSPLSIITQN